MKKIYDHNGNEKFHDLPNNVEKPIKTVDAKFFLLVLFVILILAFICSHF